MPTNNLKAIITLCVSLVLFVANDSLVKLATKELPTGEIMALRGGMIVGMLLLVIVFTERPANFAGLRHPVVLLRGLFDTSGTFTFVTALAVVPLGNLTAILLTAPLLLTAASAFLLHESVGWRRWTAVAVGFCGMLLVVKPLPANFNVYTLLGVAATLSAVSRDISTRWLPKSASTLMVTLAASLAICLSGMVIGLSEHWVAPNAYGLKLLAGAAITLALASAGVIVAFRSAEMSVLAPFRYSVIIWALLSGYFIWGDLPDAWSFAGIAVIIGSGLYIVHRERIRARASRAQALPVSSLG